jgi:hypothetical protein
LADEKQRTILGYSTPRKRPRPYFNLSPADAELAGCLVGIAGAIFAFGSLIILFFVTINLASKLMQRIVVSIAYGEDRYAAGVRIVGKSHLHLSDGTPLGAGWKWMYVLGIFVCAVLVIAPYARLLQKMGLLRDDEPKEKENSPNER